MFGKANGYIVVFNVASVQVDSSKEWLAIFKPSNNKIVVVGVLVVSPLIADSSEIVGVVLDGEVDVVIEGL